MAKSRLSVPITNHIEALKPKNLVQFNQGKNITELSKYGGRPFSAATGVGFLKQKRNTIVGHNIAAPQLNMMASNGMIELID